MDYESTITKQSKVLPGVSFRLRKLSFGRRLELLTRVRELAQRREFHAAGTSEADQLEAAILNGQIRREYVEWGLAAVEGLNIDGLPASPAAVIEQGPEDLCQEIAAEARALTELSESERKN